MSDKPVLLKPYRLCYEVTNGPEKVQLFWLAPHGERIGIAPWPQLHRLDTPTFVSEIRARGYRLPEERTE